MSTTTITVTPEDNWLNIYTGPTTTPIAVEKSAGTSAAYLAISNDTPDVATGHHISNGELKNVVLADGESLFARCIDGLSPNAENLLIITD